MPNGDRGSSSGGRPLVATTRPGCSIRMSGWRNTVGIVLFETSNSMKPYPSVFHAHTSKLRPVMGLFVPNYLDEASNRIPPTSHLKDINY